MSRFEEVKKEIEKIFKQSEVPTDPIHSKTTLDWLLRIKPDADEALQIAALAHDIERGYDGKKRLRNKDFNTYDEFKKMHAERGSQIIIQLLVKYGYNNNFIDRVAELVEKHEVGGYEDVDLVMDADSLSFFETNFDFYLMENGKEKARSKIKIMYDRMSDESKIIGEDLYKKCLAKVNNQ